MILTTDKLMAPNYQLTLVDIRWSLVIKFGVLQSQMSVIGSQVFS